MTEKERKLLKKMKHSIKKGNGHFYSFKTPYSPVKAKIIVQLRKNETFPFTTYSKLCWQDRIDDYLDTFCSDKTGKSLVAKYQYNNKWYEADQRPYNAW